MKSHGQQVNVEGEWHLQSTQSLDTELDSKNMGHQFHVEHAHLKNFVAPHLLHPPKIRANLLTLTHVWVRIIEVMLCVSLFVTTLPPALFTLRLHYMTKTK